MEHAKQISLPDASEAFMKAGDVLLVLDNGVAIQSHSQILSMHSAVICNMLSDLAQKDGKVSIPLPEFTEAQCSALLAYLYENRVSCKGAAFDNHDAAAHDAASAVARFAHIYDAPHALRHVQTYLTAFLARPKRHPGEDWTTMRILEWANLGNIDDMHELCGHSEQAIMKYWQCFQDKPNPLDPLSSRALQRIANGLHKTLLASADKTVFNTKHPDAHDFIAWRKGKQPTEQ